MHNQTQTRREHGKTRILHEMIEEEERCENEKFEHKKLWVKFLLLHYTIGV